MRQHSTASNQLAWTSKEKAVGQSTEIWKPVPVPPFDGAYEVSSLGRIRSLDRDVERKDGKPLRVRGRVLSPGANSRGYLRVTLSMNGHSEWFHLHSLIAMTFLPKPPRKVGSRGNEFVVNHISGVKTDNSVENLEYITSLENIAHARENGLLSVKGTLNNKAKLTDSDVRAIRKMYAEGMTQVQLAEIYGVYQTTISLIVRRKGWAHVA